MRGKLVFVILKSSCRFRPRHSIMNTAENAELERDGIKSGVGENGEEGLNILHRREKVSYI